MSSLEHTILLHDTSTPDVFASAPDAIKILSISYTAPDQNEQRVFTIRGMTRNSLSVSVEASSGNGAAVSVRVAPNTRTGLFTAACPPLAVRRADLLSVIARNDMTGAVGSDHAVISILPAPPALYAGSRVLVNPARFDLLAGTTDRILRRHSFHLIVLEPVISVRTLKIASPASGEIIEISDVVLKDVVNAAYSKSTPPKYERLVENRKVALRKFLAGATRPAPADERSRWGTVANRHGNASSEASRGRSPRSITPPNLLRSRLPPAHIGLSTGVGFANLTLVGNTFVVDPAKSLVEEATAVLEVLLAAGDLGGRVGVMFNERLRFQPVGTIIGEGFDSLTLIPGGEAEIREVAETKQRLTAEDVKDREEERESTLTSSWSTDVGNVIGENTSFQSSLQVGGSLDLKLPVPEIPLGAGVQLGSNTQDAHETSLENTVSTNQELSLAATARMRSQHKIRIEKSAEFNASSTATRKLRNENRQHGLKIIFHKEYRRERVTFERFGAQLCLRLKLDDPAASTRAAFLTGLDKIDPDNPALYHTSPPKGEFTRSGDLVIDGLQKAPEMTPLEWGQLFEVHWRVPWPSERKIDLRNDTKREDGSAPSQTAVLAKTPTIRLVSFRARSWSGEEYTSDSMSHFRELGGDWLWLVKPVPGVSSPTGTMGFNLPFTYVGNRWIDRRTVGLQQATFQVEADWAPSGAAYDEYVHTHREERRELLAALSKEKLMALLDIAVTDYPGAVLGKAVAEQMIMPTDLAVLRQMIDLENVQLENLPHWATPAGRGAHETISRRLERLPISIAMSDFLRPALTAAQAIVYLPVHEGKEMEALALLSDISDAQRTRVIGDLRNFRDQHYKRLPKTSLTYDQVTGPIPPIGTAANAQAWAHDWEKQRREFDVLAAWTVDLPTDGVHLEMRLTDSVATDDHLTAALREEEAAADRRP